MSVNDSNGKYYLGGKDCDSDMSDKGEEEEEGEISKSTLSGFNLKSYHMFLCIFFQACISSSYLGNISIRYGNIPQIFYFFFNIRWHLSIQYIKNCRENSLVVTIKYMLPLTLREMECIYLGKCSGKEGVTLLVLHIFMYMPSE